MKHTLTRILAVAALGAAVTGCATYGDGYYDPYHSPGYAYGDPGYGPVYPAYATGGVVYYNDHDRRHGDRSRWDRDRRDHDRDRDGRHARERERERAEAARQARDSERQRRAHVRENDRRERTQFEPEQWRTNNDSRNRQTPLSDR